jgi:DNA topoisomerase-3
MTTPPPYYNEASLLRAMETAGKFVEDETLRAAMKENGIGRPSSRAGIIETLFKRHYIRRDRKRLIATPTGIELIDLIREELLKSCELTGIWEKKLRDIEHQKYDAQQFIEELKAQVSEIVNEVMSDASNRRITVLTDEDLKKTRKRTPAKDAQAQPKAKSTPKKKAEPQDPLVGQPCPLCGKGHIIKGKTAYGCSEWKNGCTYRQPFQP